MSKHKILLTISFILLLATFFGCGSDSGKSIIFNAEKQYQKISKLVETTSIKPDMLMTEQTEEIKQSLVELNDYWLEYIDSLPRDKYPEERQNLASIAFLTVGQLSRLYFEQNQYDSAIYVINAFLTKVEPEGQFLMSAKLSLARIYQSAGEFDQAMTIYNGLIDTFYPPVDNQGTIIDDILNLPLEIVRVYSFLGNEELKAVSVQSAENYYNKLLQDWPNSSLAIASHGNLAKLYYDSEQWDKAIASLQKMTDSTGQTDIEAKMMIAAITADGKQNYKQAIRLYQDLLTQIDDTLRTPALLLRLAAAHYHKKEYAETEKYITTIKSKYQYFYRINPLPQNYFALAFKDQGNWTRAESEFQYLIDNYATSEAAFNAFIIIADHYLNDKNKLTAEKWHRRAEQFYTDIGSRYVNTTIEASALSYMAEIARREDRWNDAVKYLEIIFNKFPQSDIGRRSIIMASGVYKNRLNDQEKADSLLNLLKAELFPVSNGKKYDIITDDKL